MIDAALIALLEENADVAALCGNRIYGDRAPQSTATPYVIFWSTGGGTSYHMTGPSALQSETFKIACWAATRLDATNLAAAVSRALSGFRGMVRSLDIQSVQQEGPPDSGEEADPLEPLLYSRTLTFTFAYQQPYLAHKQ